MCETDSNIMRGQKFFFFFQLYDKLFLLCELSLNNRTAKYNFFCSNTRNVRKNKWSIRYVEYTENRFVSAYLSKYLVGMYIQNAHLVLFVFFFPFFQMGNVVKKQKPPFKYYYSIQLRYLLGYYKNPLYNGIS